MNNKKYYLVSRISLSLFLHPLQLPDVSLSLQALAYLLLDDVLQYLVERTTEGMAVELITLPRIAKQQGATIQPSHQSILLRSKMGKAPMIRVDKLLKGQSRTLILMVGEATMQVVLHHPVLLVDHPRLHAFGHIAQLLRIQIFMLGTLHKQAHQLAKTLLTSQQVTLCDELLFCEFITNLKNLFIKNIIL